MKKLEFKEKYSEFDVRSVSCPRCKAPEHIWCYRKSQYGPSDADELHIQRYKKYHLNGG